VCAGIPVDNCAQQDHANRVLSLEDSWSASFLTQGVISTKKTARANCVDVLRLPVSASALCACICVLAPPCRSILLLEDVDAAFVDRAASQGGATGRLTFSGLLNAIDGVSHSAGTVPARRRLLIRLSVHGTL
jgi:hypothetical protein